MSQATVAEYKQLKAETSDLLSSVGESLGDLCQGPPSQEHAEAYVAIDEQIQKFWTAYYELKKRHELSKLSVAVLALTKSGKSTLINSFLGNDLLPVNNVPETARICRITHSPTTECPQPVLEFKPLARRTSSNASTFPGDVLEPANSLGSACSVSSSPSHHGAVVTVHGAEEIREHLQQLNRDVRSREFVNGDEQLLEIMAPLVVLEGSAANGASSSSGADSDGDYSGIKLCLLDTPGPNEAGEEGLKYQVERLLDRVDAAIYLLDYTKLKTAEEAAVLERLKSINPSLVTRLCSRLFFAVNKMDQAGESCGLDDDETREYVAEMVTRQLNCPGFRLHPDQVLLLSARNALLSRLILQDRADPENAKRFNRIAFGAYNSKSVASRSSEVLCAAAADMLEASGVPELEQAVLGFLFEAAAGVKLVAVLDDMGRLLTEVSNVAASCRGALAASASRLAASTQALQSELDVTLNQFDCVMDGTEDLQVEVVDELRAHLGNLRSRLFQFIDTSLDADALQNAAAANAAAAEAAENGASSSSHHRRHRRHCGRRSHRHRHYSSYNAACSSNPNGVSFDTTETGTCTDCDVDYSAAAAVAGSSPCGWRKLREQFVRLFGSWTNVGCESKDELSSALMDLSEDLMSQVQIEVTEMWSVMETAANARAGRLVTSLNAAIQGLSARLEGVVEEGLQIRLEPVSLRMAAPDACQFHADLTELIEKGIGAEQARHVRSCERTELVWEARRGVCRLTPYYVQVPRRRRIVETYTSTSYVLKPDAVAAHFMGVVDAAITATERHLAAYVKEYVRRQVEAARNKVKEYGDRYLDSMGAALDAASRGADARAAALAQVDGYCNTLAALRSRLSEIQARAEQLVPHNSGTGVGVFEQLDYIIDDEDDQQQQQQQQEEESEQQQEEEEEEEVDYLASYKAGWAAAADIAAAAAGDVAVAVPTAPDFSDGAAIADPEPPAPAAVAEAAAADPIQPEICGSSSSGGMVRSGSGSSSSCPDLLTAEEVTEAIQAEAAAAAATAGTLLMSSLPQQQQQEVSAPAAAVEAGAVDGQSPDQAQPPPAAAADANGGSGDESNGDVPDLIPALEAAAPAAGEPAAAAAGFCSVIDLCSSDSERDSDQSSTPDLIGSPRAEADAAAVAGPASDLAALLGAAAAAYRDLSDDDEIELPGLLDAPAEEMNSDGISPTVEPHLPEPWTPSKHDPAAAAAAGDDLSPTVAAAELPRLTLDDIFGGVPLAPDATAAAAAAAVDGSSSKDDVFQIDIDSIIGAQLAADAEPAVVAPTAPEAVLPAAIISSSGAPPSSAAAAAAADADAVSSPAVSAAGTAVSDTFSVVTAGSNSTVFSGMTAGTGFTLGSHNTQESGFSRIQEHLADSVLAGTAAAAAAGSSEAAAAAAGSGSIYDAGSTSMHSAGPFSYNSSVGLGASSMHSAAAAGSGSGSSGDNPDQPLDTSLYASIVAHSSDDSPTAAAAGSSGTPGSSSNYDFQRDFAAALSAAGLDGVAVHGPSESGSDDWCLVEGEEVEQQHK